MAQRTVETCLALVLTTVMWAGTWAQPNPNCMPAITSLSPCIGFITGNSSTPSPSCCSQLASVVQTQAQCLCTVLNGAPQLPFVVNQTQALTLPGACKIQTPPISQCNAASGSSAAPAPAPVSGTPSVAAAPSPSTPSSVATPSVPTGAAAPKTPSVPSVPSANGGSKKSPTTTGVTPTSTSSSTTFALPLVFFLAAASAFSSF